MIILQNHQALVHANKSYPLPTFKHGDVRNLEWQKQRGKVLKVFTFYNSIIIFNNSFRKAGEA